MRILSRGIAALVVVGVLASAAPASAAPYDRALREAKRINAKKMPYVWGGGHGLRPAAPHKVRGYDCSGSVSRVLYVAGLLKRTKTSYGFESWGKRGRGQITVYVQPGHVLMRIGGRVFGTSPKNPGGGAGFFRPDPGYLKAFHKRQPRGTGSR